MVKDFTEWVGDLRQFCLMLLQALVWQVAEPNPTPMNSMISNGAPFCEGKRYANGSAQGTPFVGFCNVLKRTILGVIEYSG